MRFKQAKEFKPPTCDRNSFAFNVSQRGYFPIETAIG